LAREGKIRGRKNKTIRVTRPISFIPTFFVVRYGRPQLLRKRKRKKMTEKKKKKGRDGLAYVSPRRPLPTPSPREGRGKKGGEEVKGGKGGEGNPKPCSR